MSDCRRHIYYWKCDRPAAFHGTAQDTVSRERPDLQALLTAELRARFGSDISPLIPAGGQGNHITYVSTLGGSDAFIRIEDGPERDDYLKIESHVLDAVRAAGVPTPRVLASDASRASVPFAWQVLERLPQPDLNQLYKSGQLDLPRIARQAGAFIARWQEGVATESYGPFSTASFDGCGRLVGYHGTYGDYFRTALDRHLSYLTAQGFLTPAETNEIRNEIERATPLIELQSSCLVHKDTALWNLLGTQDTITSVIDWDDCIGGDPMDDLSLLGCFHDGKVLSEAFAGYASVKPLPAEYCRRFWLHLLRNMLFKSVIRVGAGYFNLSGGFFLIGRGGTGSDLRDFTLSRIRAALRGLRDSTDPETL